MDVNPDMWSLGLSDDRVGSMAASAPCQPFLTCCGSFSPPPGSVGKLLSQTGSGDGEVSVVVQAFLGVWGLSTLGQGPRQLGVSLQELRVSGRQPVE